MVEDPAPLDAPATALAVSGQTLAIGRADGGVALYDTVRGAATALRDPAARAAVTAIAIDAASVWWTCADGTGWRYELERQLLAPWPCAPRAGSALTVWRGIAWWSGAGALQACDTATGASIPVDRLLPRETASLPGARLTVAADGRALLIGALRAPDGTLRVAAWRAGDGLDWTPCSTSLTLESAVPPCDVALAAAGDQVAALVDGVTVAIAPARGGQAERAVIPGADTLPGSPRCVALGGRTVWWIQSGMVMRCDAAPFAAAAYAPWNAPGMRVEALAVDERGAWIGTSAGVQRIDARPGRATPASRTAFLRIPLADAADMPGTAAGQAVAQEIAGWMGTPYVYGGSTLQGADCSGFVMRALAAGGARVSHGSQQLLTDPTGLPVTDEMRFGDVLVYSGHCALYLGNGLTAETISGQKAVGIGTVWRRRDAAVRRFLDVSPTAAVAARRASSPRTAGRRTPRAASPSATSTH